MLIQLLSLTLSNLLRYCIARHISIFGLFFLESRDLRLKSL